MNKQERAEDVERWVRGMVSDYTALHESVSDAVRAAIVAPTEVAAAITANVAKTGAVRFKKGKPAQYEDNVPSLAYLFWTLREHTGMGAYRSVDSLMMCHVMFEREVYDRWELTVDGATHLVWSDRADGRILRVEIPDRAWRSERRADE